MGNKEEGAGARIHVQPHQCSLHGDFLLLHHRGGHQARKVDFSCLIILFKSIRKRELLFSFMKCVESPN